MKNSIHTETPEILLISSFPPRECGIATFSQDLLNALQLKFQQSFALTVCALEAGAEKHAYPEEVRYVLDTSEPASYTDLVNAVNRDNRIKMVLLQHEFGFYDVLSDKDFLHFLHCIRKPLLMTFHTVLSNPDTTLRSKVSDMAKACDKIIVMTRGAAQILLEEYDVPQDKITVIAHGIHLVPHLGKAQLKEKYGIKGRKVLSTFGLISSGKSIETTLEAMPAIVARNPDVLFLVLGKTHPTVLKQEGERYRRMLEEKVVELSLENHVKFVNKYLPLQELLGYLQLTDIYLFTSKDPHQAVSGTFSYAMSCGCAIISTPIPHAREVLRDDAGILVNFQNPAQLSGAVNRLLADRKLRKRMIHNGLQRAVFAAWENTAIAYARVFKDVATSHLTLQYAVPEINLDHIRRMTTDFGILQFSQINKPDPASGHTLDDNARALVAMCMHYEIRKGEKDLAYMETYLDFMAHCLQPNGSFLNYVGTDQAFTKQNQEVNLDDANGRAIWALGYLISQQKNLPDTLVNHAESIFKQAITRTQLIHSPRALAFVIKGLHYYLSAGPSPQNHKLLETLSNRLVQWYRQEAEFGWNWYEPYLTYGNSTLPEAMLCAWLSTGNTIYKNIARQSFDFLLKQTFDETGIKVVPNNGWLKKGQERVHFGEQPIDVAYTILALRRFYEAFHDERYREKMSIAFNWFLGQNHLHQIVYNPCTGGCYDGLEETQVNLNQGAESTISYLMARLAVEKPFENSTFRFRHLGFHTGAHSPLRTQLYSMNSAG